jgi:hypothetical protein
MLKLMKYELKKQMFSKIVILIILGALAIFFIIANLFDNTDMQVLGLAAMLGAMLGSLLYSLLECIKVYGKDLTTKQGYMLFMVPRNSYQILGAKILSAIIQIALTLVMFGAVMVICGTVYMLKYDYVKEMVDTIKEILSIMFNIDINYGAVFNAFLLVFLTWGFVVILGIFSLTVSETVLQGKKISGAVSAVMFLLLLWAVTSLENTYMTSIVGHLKFGTVYRVGEILYYIFFDVVFYLLSAWIMDKKLSV